MKRHTRAHVREQRSRWIRKRIGQIRREWPDWAKHEEVSNCSHLPGKLNKKDPWDCGNPQCGLCRNDGNNRRNRLERAVVEFELRESLKRGRE